MTDSKTPNWLFQIEVLHRALALLDEYVASQPDATDRFLRAEVAIALEECNSATEALTETLSRQSDEISKLNALLIKHPPQTIH